MIWFPIIGAIALASGTIFEKIVLRKKSVDIKLYQTATFLAIVISILPFVYFFWEISPLAFTTRNLLIFVAVIFFSMIANMFIFYSLKWEKISNIEPARILEPLFVILLAILFSFFVNPELYERNTQVIIPALIAGLALIFSHVKKHHIRFNKYFIAAILGSLFFALELVVSRLILDFYSPITFYFLRCSMIFLLSLVIFQPTFKKLDKKASKIVLLTGAIWSIYRIIIYYGYLAYGVISTTLIVMLAPVFIYLFAWKFLKEKINWRNMIAALVILVCVGYAMLG